MCGGAENSARRRDGDNIPALFEGKANKYAGCGLFLVRSLKRGNPFFKAERAELCLTVSTGLIGQHQLNRLLGPLDVFRRLVTQLSGDPVFGGVAHQHFWCRFAGLWI